MDVVEQTCLCDYKLCDEHSNLSYEALSNIRIRQKNLVYVVGLPINLCDEQTLRTPKWFGSFGKIKKIYLNKKTSHVLRTGSFAAFITFYRECDATKAINSMNGKIIHLENEKTHRIIKATTGSTKYCSYFLRNTICNNNSQCLYLHEWANKKDIVTKQELNYFGPKYKTIINKKYSNNSNSNSNANSNSNSKFDYTKKHRTKPPISHNISNTKTLINKSPKKKSYRKVATLLLNELIKNNTNKNNTNNEYKISNLLKDGMLTSNELKMIEMDKYNNYYYFLQSDKLIFQQFHKLQKIQKTKA